MTELAPVSLVDGCCHALFARVSVNRTKNLFSACRFTRLTFDQIIATWKIEASFQFAKHSKRTVRLDLLQSVAAKSER
jgi:hypothetical protein